VKIPVTPFKILWLFFSRQEGFLESRSENMSKRSEYKKLVLHLAKYYGDKAKMLAVDKPFDSYFYAEMAASCIESYRKADKAPYGTFPDEKLDGP